MRRSTALQQEDRHRRFNPIRIWALCAIPWLALVVGLSIHDHQRAIGLVAGGPPIAGHRLARLGEAHRPDG